MTLLTRAVAFLTFFIISNVANANTLKIGVDAIGEHFDYRYALDANSYRVLKLMSTGLLGERAEDIPAATILEKDATHYTFKLNDLKFSNGDSFTSNDVKNMYTDLMTNKKVTVYKNTLSNISEIIIIDDTTIRFNFKNVENFPMAKFGIPIFKQTDNGQVGLGPYTINEFKFPYKLSLKTNDDRLYYKNIEFSPNSLPVVRIIKLMKGEVDVLHGSVQATQVEYLNDKGFDIFSSTGSNYAYLGFNLDDETVKDLNIRKALAYGINIDSIIKNLYLKRASNAKSILGEQHPYYTPNKISYNPAKAIQYLEKSNLMPNEDGIRLEIDFSVSNNNQSLRFAQILQDQLKASGIKLNILTSDWGRFYTDIKEGNVQMYALAWVGIFDGDVYKDLFHTSSIGDAGLNRSNYSSAKMDMLIDKIMNNSLSDDQVKETIFAIQNLQFNDMIYIPLWRKDNIVISRPGIITYKPTSDGGFEAIKSIYKKNNNTKEL